MCIIVTPTVKVLMLRWKLNSACLKTRIFHHRKVKWKKIDLETTTAKDSLPPKWEAKRNSKCENSLLKKKTVNRNVSNVC